MTKQIVLHATTVIASILIATTVTVSIVAAQETSISTSPAIGDTAGQGGQESMEEPSSTPGMPSVVGVGHNFIVSIVTAQGNSTSTPPTIGGAASQEGQESAEEAPSTPGRPSVAAVSRNSISLSWGAVSGAAHYDIRYRNRDAGGSWSQTDDISGTSKTFSGLSPGTRYVFQVRAGNAAGDSSWSPIRYGTTTAAPLPLSLPDPPDRTLTVGVSTSFTLPLAFGGAAPYTYIVRGLPAGLSFTASSRTVSGKPSAIDTSTVRYIVTDSASASDEQTFTITVTASPVPSAPGRPSVTETTQTSVSLSWGAVTGATHYDARYRNRDAGGTHVPGSWSQTDNIQGTTQTFYGLTPSTRYVFEVRAGNAAGSSAWSPMRNGTTTAAPPKPPTPIPTLTNTPTPGPPTALQRAPAPTNVTATTVATTTRDKKVKVSWHPIPNVTNYRVRWYELLDGTRINPKKEDTTTQNSYTVTGLACGQDYDFDVAGRGNGINYQDAWGSIATVSGISTESCPTDPTGPTGPGPVTPGSLNKPNDVAFELGPRKGHVTLSWTNISRATEYKVRQRAFGGSWGELPSGTTTITFSIGSTKTTAVIGGLTHRVPYEWQVQAVNQTSNRTSAWSDRVYLEIPVCTATSLGDADHGLRSPTIISKTGDWNFVCYSEQFPDTNAQYFQFTLDDEAHVTVDLVSADANAYIALRQGAAMTSRVYSSNDNNDERTPGSTTNARVAMRLDSGTYTIEATMNELDPTKGKFSVQLRSVDPLPAIGHQKDHTSVYVIDSLPTPLPSPPTDGTEDPGVIFPTAIAYAVDAWNDAVSGSWPDVVICKKGSSDCASRPDDKRTTTLNVASGGEEEGNTGIADFGQDDCGSATACVKGKSLLDRHLLDQKNPDNHMPNLLMVIERPAWDGKHIRVYWTNDIDKHDDELPDGPNGERRVLWYLPGILMHEFGHTIGLGDLYGSYKRAIMYDIGFDSIPDRDTDHVDQVYRNRHGARPH